MKSVLLIGLGRFGGIWPKNCRNLIVRCSPLTREEQRVNDALPYVTNAQIGDATNEAFIASLGVRNLIYLWWPSGMIFKALWKPQRC